MLLKKDRRQIVIIALVSFLLSAGLQGLGLSFVGGFLSGVSIGLLIFLAVDWFKYWIQGGL